MNKKKRKTEDGVGDELQPQSKIIKTEDGATEHNPESEDKITGEEISHDFDVKHFRKQLNIPANKSASKSIVFDFLSYIVCKVIVILF